MHWFQKSGHHRSILIYGAIFAAILIYDRNSKGKNLISSQLIIGVLVGASVEGIMKNSIRIQGGSTS